MPPKNSIEYGIGTVYFNDSPMAIGHITDYLIEPEDFDKACTDFVLKHMSFDPVTLSCSLKINRLMLLKFMGFWQWALDWCPSKRVVHLMKYGKNARVKVKNYDRAVELIAKEACKYV